MKRILLLTVIAFALMISINLYGSLSWDSKQMISKDDLQYSCTYQGMTGYRRPNWSVAGYDTTVVAVWMDDRASNGLNNIYNDWSEDEGDNWEEPDDVLISSDADDIMVNNPSVAIEDYSTIHVVWAEYMGTTTDFDIKYARSTDKGNSWGNYATLCSAAEHQINPSIAVSGDYVHVVWEDRRQVVESDIYYRRSTDGGQSWSGREQAIVNRSDISRRPCITTSGSKVFVVWEDTDYHSSYDIFYIYNSNNGISSSWQREKRVTNDTEGNIDASIVYLNSAQHIVWHRNVDNDIMYSYTSNYGSIFSTPAVISTDNVALRPCIAAGMTWLHVVYEEGVGTTGDVCHIYSMNYGLSWSSSSTNLSNSAPTSRGPAIAITEDEESPFETGGRIHVVWFERATGRENEIWYRKGYFDGGGPGNGPGGGEECGVGQGFFAEDKATVSPNPMNSFCDIRFSVRRSKLIDFEIVDISGRMIKTFPNRKVNAGNNIFNWDGKDMNGATAKPGIYFIKSKGFETTKIIKFR